MKSSAASWATLGLFSLGLFTTPVAAQEPNGIQNAVETVNISLPSASRPVFDVAPSRQMLIIPPGRTANTEIWITNRLGRTATFVMSVEDFVIGRKAEPEVQFFGTASGPFPARSWITPDNTKVTLEYGETARVPVTVRVPGSVAPGDHQAAVMVRETQGVIINGVRMMSRIGAQMVISVPGDIREGAQLENLETDRSVYWTTPVRLNVRARNTGTVWVEPVGTIAFRRLTGRIVDEIPVDGWAVLRDARSVRTFEWAPRFALGYYRAQTNLAARTMESERPLQRLETGFWVIPVLPLFLALAATITVVGGLRFVVRRFEIVRRA